MKTAAEICRDLVSFTKSRWHPHAELQIIANDAKEVVAKAVASGELERLLAPGDQLDTGFYFRGHKIILEIGNQAGCGCHWREGVLRERFRNSMKSKYEFLRK